MPTRPDVETALATTGLLDRLAGFDPHVVGTPPLGLDRADSDIDIVCQAGEPDAVAEIMWGHFRDEQHFLIWRWRGGDRPVVCAFTAAGWRFEVFASPQPVEGQAGWRHFRVEQRLLALGGAGLRAAVMARRRAGMKTEPAFAAALELGDDPYAAMLGLYGMDEEGLRGLLGGAGFGG